MLNQSTAVGAAGRSLRSLRRGLLRQQHHLDRFGVVVLRPKRLLGPLQRELVGYQAGAVDAPVGHHRESIRNILVVVAHDADHLRLLEDQIVQVQLDVAFEYAEAHDSSGAIAYQIQRGLQYRYAGHFHDVAHAVADDMNIGGVFVEHGLALAAQRGDGADHVLLLGVDHMVRPDLQRLLEAHVRCVHGDQLDLLAHGAICLEHAEPDDAHAEDCHVLAVVHIAEPGDPQRVRHRLGGRRLLEGDAVGNPAERTGQVVDGDLLRHTAADTHADHPIAHLGAGDVFAGRRNDPAEFVAHDPAFGIDRHVLLGLPILAEGVQIGPADPASFDIDQNLRIIDFRRADLRDIDLPQTFVERCTHGLSPLFTCVGSN